ncbi:GNAT family N-acetyltransferase, partial [Aeromonas salmonicida]
CNEGPQARVSGAGVPAVLAPHKAGESAKFSLMVKLFSGDKLAVEFIGQYVVQPVKRRGQSPVL